MTGFDYSDGSKTYAPGLPFPISCITAGSSKRYMLYDINLISWLRREHHILGVLIGTLPQAPSQNVFPGLPLELMPEEVTLLIEEKLAFIVDERAWNLAAIRDGIATSQVRDYEAEIAEQGLHAAMAIKKAREAKLEEVMSRLSLDDDAKHKKKQRLINQKATDAPMTDNSLFDDSGSMTGSQAEPLHPKIEAYALTPSASKVLRPGNQSIAAPKVDASSYALFKMLHDKGYFLSPGLRFGCQYMAYPGDPLRYHSHFLTVASDWNKSINLIDLIGSGRLATGVKKSFLLGGIAPSKSEGNPPTTRAFSIEWAGM